MPRMSTPSTRPDHDSALSDRLVDRIGQHRYGMWFDHTTRLSIQGERVDVAAESQFVADWIGRHFRRDLEEVARQTIGEGASVDLRVAPEIFGKSEPAAANRSDEQRGPRHRAAAGAPARPAAKSGSRRQQLRRLEEFVVGTSNRLAFQTTQALADDPETAPPILFVHGECGVGKTHLLQGAVERRARSHPGQVVRYVTGEEFTNEYIAAVRGQKIDAFRSRMRRLDLLAIDDIHFLSNKNATQNEFLHTLDAIGLGGSNLLLASDEHPRQISRFSTALTSRFLAGMVVRIERPELAMREQLVTQLAEERGLDLTDAAARLLAARFTGSVRELRGGITKLTALRRLDGARTDAVGAIMVEQMLEGETAPGPRTPVRLGEIIEAVCTRIGVEADELLGRGRHRRVVLARGLVVHLARELTTLSFPEIARGLGRENHSTVHTAARRILRNLQANTALALPGVSEGSLNEFVEQLKYDVVRRSSSR